MDKSLKLITLLDPEMCLDCRFCKLKTVTLNNGDSKKMIHCTRLDCDNWDTKSGFDDSIREMND